MILRNAIGIDPDAQGFECALVNVQDEQRSVICKRFSVSSADQKKFIQWVKQYENIIVAIEGIDGQSKPIEQALRKEGMEFYSFPPVDIAKARDTIISKHKDNARDAEATARHAIDMHVHGKLDKYQRTWFADEGLRSLTRTYDRISKQKTATINSLWKLIKEVSSDLYLTLGGRNPDSEIRYALLNNKGILGLFVNIPDITSWQTKSKDEMIEAMNGKEYANTEKQIAALQKASMSSVCPALLAHAIKTTAEEILFLDEKKKGISAIIKSLTIDNTMVQTLVQQRGIGIVTASCMAAEIITIKRFASDDNLASYSGFGRLKNTTGDETKNEKTKPNTWYNRRLKDAFMTAARSYVQYNKESHLAAYHKALLKKGMKPMEARKRIARGLLRKLYQALKQAS